MKTNRDYLSWAWEIRNAKAEEAKKAGSLVTGQAEAATTLKKRKRHVVSRGPSEAQAPATVPIPPTATVIQVVDLEEDTVGLPQAPTFEVQVVTPAPAPEVPTLMTISSLTLT